MAAHKHNGNIYFYANGKWMDSLSRCVSQELESAVKHRKKAAQKGYRRTAELTNDQKRALGVLESGKNVFLSGEAGTG